MANDKHPVTIKKYANRRLYNTGTSAYVTLEDLATMVKAGEDFVVFDAKTGEDITRPVLAQIIFEQEGKAGQSLLPIAFLRQLIGFYGDSMQMLVPSYLEFTFDKFVGEQKKLREQFTSAMGAANPSAAASAKMFGVMEDSARRNIALFNQALTMFNPFAASVAAAQGKASESEGGRPGEAGKPSKTDIEQLRRQIADMQRNIDQLGKKD